ncbi:MAG: hypothetical protein DWQ34_18630 [Planctomycetota bacterium]|nr:MAG: hypothetical protein DWQ29_11590 [Planctomycetota bacterium]REJ89759.1 MAG: hypothetical protein DWQ34_18630 [Planctomycetota bacterium]REK26417.1 MAG: hypothetical protein DWQ41_09965 [Planctomycetota bacterium]REK32050.1 MAG: hypothetical protein DWQ45_17955 [Planctomycetota bacterium]
MKLKAEQIFTFILGLIAATLVLHSGAKMINHNSWLGCIILAVGGTAGGGAIGALRGPGQISGAVKGAFLGITAILTYVAYVVWVVHTSGGD